MAAQVHGSQACVYSKAHTRAIELLADALARFAAAGTDAPQMECQDLVVIPMIGPDALNGKPLGFARVT